MKRKKNTQQLMAMIGWHIREPTLERSSPDEYRPDRPGALRTDAAMCVGGLPTAQWSMAFRTRRLTDLSYASKRWA